MQRCRQYNIVPAAPLNALPLQILLLTVIRSIPSSRGSAGCGLAPPTVTGSTAAASLDFQSVQREFYLHVPSQYDKNANTALVLAFHGWGGNGQQVAGNGLSAQADTATFVVVAPTGLAENTSTTSWNAGSTSSSPGPSGPTCDTTEATGLCYSPSCTTNRSCNQCDWTTCVDDVAFVNALLDWVEARLCIDTTRIYATGYSTYP